MPLFEHVTNLPADHQWVFEFLADVHNLPKVMPPKPQFTIIDAPPRLLLGARIHARVYRYGLWQTMINEVTWFEEGVGFTDVMVKGPFSQFEHTHRVEPVANGCRMSDRIVFAPPKGPLGWIVTASRIEQELSRVFAYRDVKFSELFGSSSTIQGASNNPMK